MPAQALWNEYLPVRDDESFSAESLAELIVESAADFAILTTTPDGLITSWNPGAVKLLGWSPEEAVGMKASEIFTAEDRQAGVPVEEMRRADADGRAVDERWHLRSDGSRFWGSGLMMPLKSRGGRPSSGYLKMVRDRTAERAAEQRFHSISAALPGFVFEADSDGANTATNEQFQTYTGCSAEMLNGEGWLKTLHPDDRARAVDLWSQAVVTGRTYEARYRFRGKDGQYRCFACRGVPERDELGRVVRWVGTCIDVENEARARTALENLNRRLEHRATEASSDLATAIDTLQGEIADRMRAEEALRQSQKMEAIGQLTGGVAHDFNNLLTVIRSSADLLRSRDLPEERRRRYVDAISDSADRAAALTGQLLAFARRQPLAPVVFDAADRLQGLETILTTTIGPRVRLRLEVRCRPCRVLADPHQFDTAVLNIAVNARDAMNGEGELILCLRRADGLPSIRGHAASPGRYVAVDIADSGAGMTPQVLERVFEPFFTTKDVGHGTGLGLSQVHGFAKQSGGEVDVRSAPGEGSTFTLYLPEAEPGETSEPMPAPAPPSSAAAAKPAVGRVLVVEDNDLVGEFALQLLQDLGYGATRVSGAAEGLELLERESDRYAAVFSDVVMAGMNGVDFADRVRERFPGLPVILTSGYSEVLAAEGAHGFPLLQKPYSVEALSRALRSVGCAPPHQP